MTLKLNPLSDPSSHSTKLSVLVGSTSGFHDIGSQTYLLRPATVTIVKCPDAVDPAHRILSLFCDTAVLMSFRLVYSMLGCVSEQPALIACTVFAAYLTQLSEV